MEKLWSFKTANFTVALLREDEPDPDLSWDDTGEVQANLESGLWVNSLFVVKVYCNGHEVGADYLGNSIYENPADFRKEHIGARGRWGSYFTDMVHEAISRARKSVRKLQDIRVRVAA